jgi:hypothetical protein
MGPQSNEPEIILNLWYVQDDDGSIYCLRAKAYVASGAESEELALLKVCADVDHPIAKLLPVHVEGPVEGKATMVPVGHISMFGLPRSPIAPWEDAICQLEPGLRPQTGSACRSRRLSALLRCGQMMQGTLRPSTPLVHVGGVANDA